MSLHSEETLYEKHLQYTYMQYLVVWLLCVVGLECDLAWPCCHGALLSYVCSCVVLWFLGKVPGGKSGPSKQAMTTTFQTSALQRFTMGELCVLSVISSLCAEQLSIPCGLSCIIFTDL